jgi:hypothetical protein
MKRIHLTIAALALLLALSASPAAAAPTGPNAYSTCYYSRSKPVVCTRLPVKPAPRYTWGGGW